MSTTRRLLTAAVIVTAAAAALTTGCTAGRTLSDGKLPPDARDAREALPGDAALWVRAPADGWRELQGFLQPLVGADSARGLTEYAQERPGENADLWELTGPRVLAQVALLLDGDSAKSGFDPSRPVVFALWSVDAQRLMEAASLGLPAEAGDLPKGIATTVRFGAADPRAWAAHLEQWWAAQPLAERLSARVEVTSESDEASVRLVVFAPWPGADGEAGLEAFLQRPAPTPLRLTPALASFFGDPADLALYLPLENARAFAVAQAQLHHDQRAGARGPEEAFEARLRTAGMAARAYQMLEPSQAEVEDYALLVDAAPGQGLSVRGLSTYTEEGRRLAKLSPPPRSLPALRDEGAIAALDFAFDTEAAFAATGPLRGFAASLKDPMAQSAAPFWTFLRSPMAVMASEIKKDERLAATGSLTGLHLRVYPPIGGGGGGGAGAGAGSGGPAIPRAAAILSFRDDASADRNAEKIREWAQGPLQSFVSVDRPAAKKGAPPLVTVGALAVASELRAGPEAKVEIPAGFFLELGPGALEAALGLARSPGQQPLLELLRKGAFTLRAEGEETVNRFSLQVGAPPSAPEPVQWRFDPLRHSAEGIDCRLQLTEKLGAGLVGLIHTTPGLGHAHIDGLYETVDAYQGACAQAPDTAARAGVARERLSRLRADVAKLDAQARERERAFPPSVGSPPPAPEPRIKVELPKTAPVKGRADAKVTLVIFSDFECPFCARVEPTLAALEQRYGDDLRLVFLHQPLAFHPNAKPAAQASVAAQRQGKFWEYKALLFEDIRNLGDAALVERARALGLDVERFERDRTSEATVLQVEEDMRLAQRYGARGTPTFFINGQKLVGARPLDGFVAVVEEERRRADALLAQGVKPEDLYGRLIEDGLGEVPAPPPQAYRPTEAPSEQKYRHVPLSKKATQVFGSPTALVTVVEFISYPCPFCARAEPTMQALQKKYGKNLRRVVLHQPLPFHAHGKEAAITSMFASGKGKGPQMHALLLENQKNLTPAELEGYAQRLRLPVKQLRAAWESEAWKAELEAQMELGRRSGASGTPTFFINGRVVVGAQPQATFEGVIDEELARAEAALKAGTPKARLYETLSAGPAPVPGTQALQPR